MAFFDFGEVGGTSFSTDYLTLVQPPITVALLEYPKRKTDNPVKLKRFEADPGRFLGGRVEGTQIIFTSIGGYFTNTGPPP